MSTSRDLLRIVFKLVSWEHRVKTSGSSSGSFLVETEGDSSLQATVLGLTALESHIEQQSPEWTASVQSAVQDVIAALPHDKVNELTASIATESDQTSDLTVTPLVRHALLLASKVNVNAYGILDSRPSTQSNGGSESKAVGFGLFPAV
eukprot:gene41815-51828_t